MNTAFLLVMALLGVLVANLLIPARNEADRPQYIDSPDWPGRVQLLHSTTCAQCHGFVPAGDHVHLTRFGRAVIGCCCHPIGGLS